MKTKFKIISGGRLLLLLILLCLLPIISCNKVNDISAEAPPDYTSIESKEKPLSIPKRNEVGNEELPSDFQPFENVTYSEVQGLTETQASTLLEPMVYSGETLYNSLISQVINSSEWANLTSQEQSYILNFTPQQKAMLEVLFQAASKDFSSASETPRWVHCGVSALGINQAYGIFVNAFKVGMSATTAVQVLKFVGLKYLGYVALAIAVYEFVQCVSSDNSVRELINEFMESYVLPIQSPAFLNYWATKEHLLDTETDYGDNFNVYYNSSNNKYYSDSSFTTLVPDGYYSMNFSNIFYVIVDGESIAAYKLSN